MCENAMERKRKRERERASATERQQRRTREQEMREGERYIERGREQEIAKE